MKKALLIGLALGLVVAGAVPALAVDLTASGWIGVATTQFRNTSPAPPHAAAFYSMPGFHHYSPASAFNDETGSTITGRGELGFLVRASEDLYGCFRFRMTSEGSSRWGNLGNDWGQEGGATVSVKVVNLFMDFRVPPQLPLWFRVGLQPVAIRPWIFMYELDPALQARVMIEPIKLSISAYFAKLLENSNVHSWDAAEFYAVDAKIPLSFDSVNISPGVFFAFQNHRFVGDEPDAKTLWWLGINVDGGIGPVKMQVDFIYNGGTLDYTTAADMDYGSWLINGVVSFVWNKLEVGIGAKYVKGEDDATYDIESFQLPGSGNYGSESMAVSTDFVVFDNGWMMPGPGWPADIGLIDGPSTFWFGYWNIRGFVYFQVLDWLKVGAQVGYIGDTVKNGDCIGTDSDDDENIGFEMDFGVNVQIYKNLALHSAFGYIFAGKALSQGTGFKPDDPWGWQTRLMYMF